ncbi:uncharacterized protein LOC131927987 isoform X1 [Physella acuta]|uniref:uncharacterized protein LOC131927987 isoform X1 n=2 Tax=Physella acuta TaxID=109671 RepID=UPI0027DC237C|nr:uncharacterized protein LOC131927987 isoform X1 [Physella acuta]
MDTSEKTLKAVDEGTKEGFVRLKIKMNGLKIKSSGFKIMKFPGNRHPLPEAKNATIEPPEFSTRGIVFEVKGGIDTDMKSAHYRLVIKLLPYDIIPSESYIKGEDGWIYMFLKKKDHYQSWEKYIREGSLETA